MILGKVNAQEEPEIFIALVFNSKHQREKAIIDTGFNGYLSIPSSLVKGWYFFGYEKYEIATGDIVEEKVYLGKISWNNKVQDVYAVTSHSQDILIGTKLLRHNRLLIDFPKKQVWIRS